MRVDVALTAFRLLINAKFGKLTAEEKPELIKTYQKLKKATADFEDLIKAANDKFKDEPNSKELVEATLADEAAKEVETDIKSMGEEQFGRLIDSNSETGWTLAQVDALHFALVGEE